MATKYKIDPKTLTIIKRLRFAEKKGDLNEVDKQQMADLISGVKTLKDIQIEKDRCREDYIYFIDTFIQVKNKFDNPDTMPDILKERCLGDMVKFVLYDIQRELTHAIFNDDKVISTKSRQIGFTTTTLACALYMLSFQNNKSVLLYSKTEKDAIETLTELKFMYDSLPFFLRRNALKRNEKQLILGNRRNSSKINAQTSGRQSGRSQSATQLITDEADYIDGIESIYKAALFTISATKGKIIVLSTPNLYGSWFYKMIQSARKGENGFTLVEGAQDTIPYRDQAWYDEQCKLLNYEKKSMDTELNMKWILPYDTYFHDEKLKSVDVIEEIDHVENIVKIYYPQSIHDDYMLAVDVQEEGTHFNAVTLWNLTKQRIEGTCLTRLNLYEYLVELSKIYRNKSTDQRAKIQIERNRGYYLIKKFEENDLAYLLLPNIRYIKKTDTYEFDLDKDGNPYKLGFVTTESTRKKALITLGDFLYKVDKLPFDLHDECMKFVIKSRGKPMGLEHDDLIMSTAIALFTNEILQQAHAKKKGNRKLTKFLKEYQKQNTNVHRQKEQDVKRQIADTIKGKVLRDFVAVNDTNLTGLDLQLLNLGQSDDTSTKIKSAMMALM